jgi:hypothetical protein
MDTDRLMQAINGFRQPRPESVMGAEELGRVTVPTVFLWGDRRPLPGTGRRPPVDREDAGGHAARDPGGHAPWFDDLAGSVAVITGHLAATGFPPTTAGSSHPAA